MTTESLLVAKTASDHDQIQIISSLLNVMSTHSLQKSSNPYSVIRSKHFTKDYEMTTEFQSSTEITVATVLTSQSLTSITNLVTSIESQANKQSGITTENNLTLNSTTMFYRAIASVSATSSDMNFNSFITFESSKPFNKTKSSTVITPSSKFTLSSIVSQLTSNKLTIQSRIMTDLSSFRMNSSKVHSSTQAYQSSILNASILTWKSAAKFYYSSVPNIPASNLSMSKISNDTDTQYLKSTKNVNLTVTLLSQNKSWSGHSIALNNITVNLSRIMSTIFASTIEGKSSTQISEGSRSILTTSSLEKTFVPTSVPTSKLISGSELHTFLFSQRIDTQTFKKLSAETLIGTGDSSISSIQILSSKQFLSSNVVSKSTQKVLNIEALIPAEMTSVERALSTTNMISKYSDHFAITLFKTFTIVPSRARVVTSSSLSLENSSLTFYPRKTSSSGKETSTNYFQFPSVTLKVKYKTILSSSGLISLMPSSMNSNISSVSEHLKSSTSISASQVPSNAVSMSSSNILHETPDSKTIEVTANFNEIENQTSVTNINDSIEVSTVVNTQTTDVASKATLLHLIATKSDRQTNTQFSSSAFSNTFPLVSRSQNDSSIFLTSASLKHRSSSNLLSSSESSKLVFNTDVNSSLSTINVSTLLPKTDFIVERSTWKALKSADTSYNPMSVFTFSSLLFIQRMKSPTYSNRNDISSFISTDINSLEFSTVSNAKISNKKAILTLKNIMHSSVSFVQLPNSSATLKLKPFASKTILAYDATLIQYSKHVSSKVHPSSITLMQKAITAIKISSQSATPRQNSIEKTLKTLKSLSIIGIFSEKIGTSDDSASIMITAAERHVLTNSMLTKSRTLLTSSFDRPFTIRTQALISSALKQKLNLSLVKQTSSLFLFTRSNSKSTIETSRFIDEVKKSENNMPSKVNTEISKLNLTQLFKETSKKSTSAINKYQSTSTIGSKFRLSKSAESTDPTTKMKSSTIKIPLNSITSSKITVARSTKLEGIAFLDLEPLTTSFISKRISLLSIKSTNRNSKAKVTLIQSDELISTNRKATSIKQADKPNRALTLTTKEHINTSFSIPKAKVTTATISGINFKFRSSSEKELIETQIFESMSKTYGANHEKTLISQESSTESTSPRSNKHKSGHSVTYEMKVPTGAIPKSPLILAASAASHIPTVKLSLYSQGSNSASLLSISPAKISKSLETIELKTVKMLKSATSLTASKPTAEVWKRKSSTRLPDEVFRSPSFNVSSISTLPSKFFTSKLRALFAVTRVTTIMNILAKSSIFLRSNFMKSNAVEFASITVPSVKLNSTKLFEILSMRRILTAQQSLVSIDRVAVTIPAIGSLSKDQIFKTSIKSTVEIGNPKLINALSQYKLDELKSRIPVKSMKSHHFSDEILALSASSGHTKSTEISIKLSVHDLHISRSSKLKSKSVEPISLNESGISTNEITLHANSSFSASQISHKRSLKSKFLTTPLKSAIEAENLFLPHNNAESSSSKIASLRSTKSTKSNVLQINTKRSLNDIVPVQSIMTDSFATVTFEAVKFNVFGSLFENETSATKLKIDSSLAESITLQNHKSKSSDSQIQTIGTILKFITKTKSAKTQATQIDPAKVANRILSTAKLERKKIQKTKTAALLEIDSHNEFLTSQPNLDSAKNSTISHIPPEKSITININDITYTMYDNYTQNYSVKVEQNETSDNVTLQSNSTVSYFETEAVTSSQLTTISANNSVHPKSLILSDFELTASKLLQALGCMILCCLLGASLAIFTLLRLKFEYFLKILTL